MLVKSLKVKLSWIPACAGMTKWLLVVVVVLAMTAFSFLAIAAPRLFNSPDEASNAFFAERFAETSTLRSPAPYAIESEGIAHPRSMRVVDGELVPGGFIGLPVLAGVVGKITPLFSLLLTPLLAVLGALAWGGIIAKYFGRRVGWIAGALWLCHPAWWYWASRPLMPNVVFLALVLLSAWIFLCQPLRQRNVRGWVEDVLVGIIFAFAFAIRPAEMYWLAPAAFLLMVFYRKELPWRRIGVVAVATAVSLVPFVMINQATYGSWFGTGYGGGSIEQLGIELPHGKADALLGPLRPYLFPLGFAPRTALDNFFTYGVKFFAWWSVLVIAAHAWFGFEKWKKRETFEISKTTLAFALVAVGALYLIPLYGSWILADNSQSGAVTIGSSYIRYWLPLFCLSTLPVAMAVEAARSRIFAALRPGWSSKLVIVLGFAVYVVLSGYTVFFAPAEGLLAIRANLMQYAEVRDGVEAATESNALIVVDRSDKYLFPARAVLQPLRSDYTYEVIGKLAATVPVYYFGVTLPEVDLQYVREVKLAKYALRFLPVKRFGGETLYRVVGASGLDGVATIGL